MHSFFIIDIKKTCPKKKKQNTLSNKWIKNIITNNFFFLKIEMVIKYFDYIKL